MRAAMHALGCGGDAVVPTLLEKGRIANFLDLRVVRLANPKASPFQGSRMNRHW